MNRFVTAIALLTIVPTMGCSANSCTIDADCFAGEACIEQQCEIVERQDAGSADTGEVSDDQGSGTDDADVTHGADMSVTTTDMSNSDDTSTTPDVSTSPDAGTDMSGPACTVDPFSYTCIDDGFEDNNQWIDGTRLLPATAGCNPDFIPVDESYVATMCPLDQSDWYYFNFFPCQDQSYVVEWQLQLESDCDPSVMTLEPLSFKCDESFVDCTPIDGKPTIRMIVSTQNFQNLQSTYVQVHNNGRNDVTFDYRIHVSVRQ